MTATLDEQVALRPEDRGYQVCFKKERPTQLGAIHGRAAIPEAAPQRNNASGRVRVPTVQMLHHRKNKFELVFLDPKPTES